MPKRIGTDAARVHLVPERLAHRIVGFVDLVCTQVRGWFQVRPGPIMEVEGLSMSDQEELHPMSADAQHFRDITKRRNRLPVDC